MNIIVCYKLVPDAQGIIIQPDSTLSLDKAQWEISQYDLNAIEAGMQIIECVGGKLSALSVGGKQLGENSKQKKGVLSKGPADLFLVVDESLIDADVWQTASALASSIKRIGNIDLILCGEGSSDLYTQQVGIQLGEILDMATINAVSKITVEDSKLIVERSLENEVEVLEVSLPAVVSVSSDINQPRYTIMRDILEAGKKPVTQWNLEDIGINGNEKSTEVISTLASQEVGRKQIIVEGDSREIVAEFLENIRNEM